MPTLKEMTERFRLLEPKFRPAPGDPKGKAVNDENRSLPSGDILNALPVFKQAVEAVASLEETLEERKREVTQRAQSLLTMDAPLDIHLLIVKMLYWESDVKASVIADTIGIPVNGITKIAGTCSVISACRECGIDIKFEVTSRTAAREKRSNRRNYSRIGNYDLCAQCEIVEKERRNLFNVESEAMIERSNQRLNELRAMPYTEYLQTPEWNTTRNRALKRASNQCQLCNRNGQLNVHHRTYVRLGEEDNEDLIVLCQGCHAKHHDVGGETNA